MAHYHVQHVYSSVYVLMRATPYLPAVNDTSAQVSIYLVGDLANTTQSQLNCSVKSFDSFDSRLSVTYNVTMTEAGVLSISTWSYPSLMEQARCSNSSQCLMLCSLNSSIQQTNEAQSLLFARPKNITLSNPNLRIVSVQQRSMTEVDVTIQADKPALFVWIAIPEDVSGYFSRNGFHMFENQVTITLTSWTTLTNFRYQNSDFEIISLYDVIQP